MARLSRKPGTIILVITVLVYSGAVLSVGAYRARVDQSSTSDFDDFWLTARHYVDTGEVVEEYGVHNYPPFFLLCLIPLSLLPLKVASVVFNLGSLLGFILCVRLVDGWMVRGAREAPGDCEEPSKFVRIAAPIGMALPYVTGCLVLGQMSLWTLVMLVLTWDAMERRRRGPAGFWLALAISTKVYPAIFLLYFGLKRQWRACGYVLLWLTVFNGVLPAISFGSGETRRQYAAFWRGTVRGHSSLNLAVVNSDKMSYTNQSTALLVHRLTQPTDSGVDLSDGAPRFVNWVDWRDQQAVIAGVRLAWAQWLWIAFACFVVGVTIWTCRHPAKQLSLARQRIEYAAFMPLSLLLSPIVWSFYYAIIYLPLALVAWIGLTKWRRGQRRSLELAVTLVWWGGVIAIAVPFARMCGYHAAASAALLGVLLWMAGRSGLSKTATPRESQKENPPARNGGIVGSG